MNDEEKIFFKTCSTSSESPIEINQIANSSENLWKIGRLGFVFLILYSSTSAFQIMISQIYHQMGYSSLGNLTLIANCFSMSISSIFAPFIAKFFSFKVSMFICSIAFVLFQMVGVFTSYCKTIKERNFLLCNDNFIYFSNIFSAILLGFFAVILWICQSGYITNLCDHMNKSLYFGVFSCIFQLSIFIGSLMTSIIMKLLKDHLIFFIICVFVSFISTLGFLCLPHVETSNFIEKSSLKENNRELLKIFKDRKKISISAVIAFCGLEIGFWIGNLFRLVEITLTVETLTEEEVNTYTAWVFAFLGSSEVLGGLITGYLGDIKVKKYTLVYFANLLIFISFNLSLFMIYERNYTLTFVVAGFLGVGDCMLQVMINALISTEGNNILHFSHSTLIQNMAVAVSIILGLMLDSSINLIVMMLLQVILVFITIRYNEINK